MGDGGTAAVLADEGAILVELDVHTVSVFSQGVFAPQLAVVAQRALTIRALLISITGRTGIEKLLTGE